MDDFVRNKLTEWGFSDLIQRFKDEEIDQEALCCLDDQEIVRLIDTAGKRAKFKKKLQTLQSQPECQEPAHSTLVLPSTSNRNDKGKRKLVPQVEETKKEIPAKRLCNTYKEDRKLFEVKRIMNTVDERLQNHDRTELNVFLRNKIHDLKTDKREMIGVFGRTGAGKSSLINAVIGEKHLLPSGSLKACTTAMIKVEANMHNNNYEAHIEFITKKEWKNELWWSLKTISGDNGDEENTFDRHDDEYHDTVEKLTDLYGEQWQNKSAENLMEAKYFREIPEFLQSMKKILSCNSAKELSAKILKYTRSGLRKENSGEVQRFYWPLVKCVTVKVPHNDLLQHVTLVDLPGNGDRNESRDKMWKRIVGDCSTVWIVANITRPAEEKETWDILKSTCSLMGNGGECQNIHFICTKTDTAGDDENSEAADFCHILKNNMEAKKKVRQDFNKLKDVKKQFKDDCFEVFTVSAKEFLKPRQLSLEDTEIPELQKFLRSLNDQHSETLNYVFGAYGILSLMKAARCEDASIKTSVSAELEEKLTREKDKVISAMENACRVFQTELNTGVENSKTSCENALEKILFPRKSGRGFHRTLRCVVENNGIYKPGKNKKEINMNMTLSSLLSERIDQEFRKTFPNDGNSGEIYEAINKFTLDTDKLIQNNKDVELQLIFIKTEEEKMKGKLSRIILDRKKAIYNSLVGKIEETMRECYTRAAEVRGKDSLIKMREIIRNHVCDSKATMFDLAKDAMLTQLQELTRDILKTLTDTMQRSIEVSLEMNDNSIPDISTEHSLVEKFYKELKSTDEDNFLLWPDMDD